MNTFPEEIVINGRTYVAANVGTRISPHLMYDCHLFRPCVGSTVDEIIADFVAEVRKPHERYGKPMLCPIIVLEGKREIRHVGEMVFPRWHHEKSFETVNESQLRKWRDAVLADPDIPRLVSLPRDR